MNLNIKPKFYKGELDNPYEGEDETKSTFWKWERIIFGPGTEGSPMLKDNLVRGIKLLMKETGDDMKPDDIPDGIREANAPLEEKAFVAQMYSNELGRNLVLQEDPSQIDWTAYFKD